MRRVRQVQIGERPPSCPRLGVLLRVPAIRIMACWGLYWGPLVVENYHSVRLGLRVFFFEGNPPQTDPNGKYYYPLLSLLIGGMTSQSELFASDSELAKCLFRKIWGGLEGYSGSRVDYSGPSIRNYEGMFEKHPNPRACKPACCHLTHEMHLSTSASACYTS